MSAPKYGHVIGLYPTTTTTTVHVQNIILVHTFVCKAKQPKGRPVYDQYCHTNSCLLVYTR